MERRRAPKRARTDTASAHEYAEANKEADDFFNFLQRESDGQVTPFPSPTLPLPLLQLFPSHSVTGSPAPRAPPLPLRAGAQCLQAPVLDGPGHGVRGR